MLEQSSDTRGAAAVVEAPLAVDLESLGDAPPDVAYQRKRLGWVFYIAAGWLILLVLAAVFANWLPFVKDPQQTFSGMSRQGPNASHWFGGDNIGKDVFSRCIYGARKSLSVGVFAYGGALVVGGALGLVAGYYRNRIEAVITGVLDIALAFPPLVLLIAISSFTTGRTILGFKPSPTLWLIVALIILATPNVARIIRAQTLVYREREFIMASRTLGARNMRIMMREILPNVLPTVGSFALIGVANLIVVEGALAFVGASDPNEPSWGVMINQGRAQLASAPHIVLFPAMMIFLTVLSMNYLGDKVRERLEVKEANV